jgi:hypothetical protein
MEEATNRREQTTSCEGNLHLRSSNGANVRKSRHRTSEVPSVRVREGEVRTKEWGEKKRKRRRASRGSEGI